MWAGIGLVCLIAVTIAVTRLKPAAPEVERSTVWTDTVKRGPMVRQVRGLGTLVVAARTDYRRLRLLAPPLLVVAGLLCAFVAVAAPPVNGARRWLAFGSLTFQPSELAKVAVAIWLSAHLAHTKPPRTLKELAKPEVTRDAVVPNALWSAALVAYARCFGRGRRSGLAAEDVRTLPLEGEVIKYHRWVLAERDKLTTHSTDPFETARIGAALSSPGQAERRVEGIVVLTASHVLVDDTGVRQLGGLASELARQTAGKAQRQQDIVLADAQQLGLDRLYELPPLRTGPPAGEGAGDGP